MTSAEYDAFDEMRQQAMKTAALMRAAERALESPIKGKGSDSKSRAWLEDLAHLIGAALEAADDTVEAAAQVELAARGITAAVEEA